MYDKLLSYLRFEKFFQGEVITIYCREVYPRYMLIIVFDNIVALNPYDGGGEKVYTEIERSEYKLYKFLTLYGIKT